MLKYILSLDQGTTSSRTIVFNKQGEIVSKAQYEYEQIYPKAGWVEHNPDAILKSQLRSLADALIDGGIEAKEIAAIGITNQRETTVLWDKRTGKPVYNAIVWQCRRTAAMCEQLKAEGLGDYIKEHTGLIIDAYFSATKIKWILDNVEGARALAEEGNLLFGTIDTWLIWNLTGKRVHVTDYSNASRTMLFDVDNLCWDKYLCDKLGIPMSILPRVAPSSEVYGAVSQGIPGIEALAGIPICSAIGDQQAALFGQACFNPGQAKNTYGTGCFLLMNTGKERVHSKNNLVTGIAWGIGDEIEYCIEGSAFNAGSVIQWLRDEMEIVDSAQKCDKYAEQVPDSNGVYFVPAFTGLGAPYWDMYARGTMVGLTRGVNKRHICRAVLEAITYQMTDLLEAMKADSGIELQELRVDGGASVSNIMMQIQADMIQTAVNRPKCVETTALGAAYLAGLAVGFWNNMDEIENIREVSKVFKPEMDTETRNRLYKGWKRAVERAIGWEEKNEENKERRKLSQDKLTNMDIKEKSLELHKKLRGKLEIKSRVQVKTKEDLSLAYTPGVAQACLEIKADPSLSYELTRRWNTVAVITDGTAVLGLGDIGPEAGMPVMEGKCILFKEFADVDAFPICIDSKDTDEIVNTVKLISKSFGGINLEDISAPRCFEIEQRLKKECDIPVFHDDQHGTAIIVTAGIMNALKITGKDKSRCRAVICGAGAAGTAIAKMLIAFGIGEITVCDKIGILNRNDTSLSDAQKELAGITNSLLLTGTLSDALKGADIFVGVSAPGIVSEEMIKSMNKDAIVFAMANPIPEIMPDIAKKAGAAVVGTGRSDFPNQVNNVLAFPGIFKGALSVRARDINEEMKLAASYAIASLVDDTELSADYILPHAFDERIGNTVAEAVAKAAISSGVSRI